MTCPLLDFFTAMTRGARAKHAEGPKQSRDDANDEPQTPLCVCMCLDLSGHTPSGHHCCCPLCRPSDTSYAIATCGPRAVERNDMPREKPSGLWAIAGQRGRAGQCWRTAKLFYRALAVLSALSYNISNCKVHRVLIRWVQTVSSAHRPQHILGIATDQQAELYRQSRLIHTASPEGFLP